MLINRQCTRALNIKAMTSVSSEWVWKEVWKQGPRTVPVKNLHGHNNAAKDFVVWIEKLSYFCSPNGRNTNCTALIILLRHQNVYKKGVRFILVEFPSEVELKPLNIVPCSWLSHHLRDSEFRLNTVYFQSWNKDLSFADILFLWVMVSKNIQEQTHDNTQINSKWMKVINAALLLTCLDVLCLLKTGEALRSSHLTLHMLSRTGV